MQKDFSKEILHLFSLWILFFFFSLKYLEKKMGRKNIHQPSLSVIPQKH